jgi:hypothetical protein
MDSHQQRIATVLCLLIVPVLLLALLIFPILLTKSSSTMSEPAYTPSSQLHNVFIVCIFIAYAWWLRKKFKSFAYLRLLYDGVKRGTIVRVDGLLQGIAQDEIARDRLLHMLNARTGFERLGCVQFYLPGHIDTGRAVTLTQPRRPDPPNIQRQFSKQQVQQCLADAARTGGPLTLTLNITNDYSCQIDTYVGVKVGAMARLQTEREKLATLAAQQQQQQANGSGAAGSGGANNTTSASGNTGPEAAAPPPAETSGGRSTSWFGRGVGRSGAAAGSNNKVSPSPMSSIVPSSVQQPLLQLPASLTTAGAANTAGGAAAGAVGHTLVLPGVKAVLNARAQSTASTALFGSGECMHIATSDVLHPMPAAALAPGQQPMLPTSRAVTVTLQPEWIPAMLSADPSVVLPLVVVIRSALPSSSAAAAAADPGQDVKAYGSSSNASMQWLV